MGRKEVGSKGAVPEEESSTGQFSIRKPPQTQNITITLDEPRPGELDLNIAENTFISMQVAALALEAANNMMMRAMEGEISIPPYKQPLADGEIMALTVQCNHWPADTDEVSIAFSSFPCDIMAATALRLAMQFLNQQMIEALQGRIVTPGGPAPVKRGH